MSNGYLFLVFKDINAQTDQFWQFSTAQFSVDLLKVENRYTIRMQMSALA